MAIIIQKNGSEPEWLEEASFKKELDLQSYIAENPAVMPLRELAGDSPPMIVGKEFPTSNGPIDLLAIDRHGRIYIIETKLDFNHSKRQVVAQVMDYAAALWRDFSTGAEEFIKAINNKYNIDLGNKLIESFDLDENEAANITDNLAKSLREGSFKLLVLMDKIDEKLKDLILFINTNSQFNIYAIELKYYRKGQLAIIIPELYGAEVRKRTASADGQFSASSPDDFWSAVEANQAIETTAMKRLVEAIESSVQDDADLTYLTNPSGTQVALIGTKQRTWPLLLYAEGKLRLECRLDSMYHRINKILLRLLGQERLFLKEEIDPEKWAFKVLDLTKASSQEIDKLIALYQQAIEAARADDL